MRFGLQQWIRHSERAVAKPLRCSLIGRLFSAGVNSRSDWLIDLRGRDHAHFCEYKRSCASQISSVFSQLSKSEVCHNNSKQLFSKLLTCLQTAFLKAHLPLKSFSQSYSIVLSVLLRTMFSGREISPPKRPRVEVIDLESDDDLPEVKVEVKDEPEVIIDEPMIVNWERVAIIDRDYQRRLKRLEL